MQPIRHNLHSLVTDAGSDVRAVLNSYPAWIEGHIPGHYYRLVTMDIIPCIASDRWQTLSQWEATPGLLTEENGTR